MEKLKVRKSNENALKKIIDREMDRPSVDGKMNGEKSRSIADTVKNRPKTNHKKH